MISKLNELHTNFPHQHLFNLSLMKEILSTSLTFSKSFSLNCDCVSIAFEVLQNNKFINYFENFQDFLLNISIKQTQKLANIYVFFKNSYIK